MGFFKKKIVMKTYDKENKKPVIKASICNGEQVVGFKDIHTGKIEEIMLIKNQADLDAFKKMYGIDGEIEKEYGDEHIRKYTLVYMWWIVEWTVVGFGRLLVVHFYNRNTYGGWKCCGRSDMLYNNYWNSFRKAVFQNC